MKKKNPNSDAGTLTLLELEKHRQRYGSVDELVAALRRAGAPVHRTTIYRWLRAGTRRAASQRHIAYLLSFLSPRERGKPSGPPLSLRRLQLDRLTHVCQRLGKISHELREIFEDIRYLVKIEGRKWKYRRKSRGGSCST